ncbi:MAG: bifunctional metallophosphatase/5'-nucleotidase [Chloroflexi bacterium]|nr:MAG: bifunctional metallophosphatase/5'-nucleotidase [Chloroflexota bacterium]
MKINAGRFLKLLLVAGVLAAFLGAAAANAQEPTTVTILETSDVHGHIYNWDFFGNAEKDQGLAIVSTLVEQERAADPNLLLLDNGDTIQGTPLIYYYNTKKTDETNPMAAVMNAMGYDAMTIGNHEFNYGQDVLDKFISEAQFPVMSANIRNSDGSQKYTPYIIKDVNGVKVGILSLTTVGIPVWEKPENIAGLRFDDAIETAKEYIPKMKEEGATVIVALSHSGAHVEPADSRAEGAWETDYTTWVDKGYADVPDQNFIIKLAEAVPEIDVIMAGHAHSTIPQSVINGVLIVEPYKWGRGVSKVTLKVDDAGNVIEKTGEFISGAEVTPDQAILDMAKDYQDTALAYVNSTIGTATGDFPGAYEARWKDGALADFINAVQLDMAADAGYPADISLAAIFNNEGHFSAGDIKISDVYGIYQYDNTLYVMEVTGDILKRALEHDAEYWAQVDPAAPAVTDPETLLAGDVRDYNWDMYSGIDYKIDISKPVGERVVDLTYQGAPVTPEQKFVLAVNNYRAGGGGGYSMFKEGKILWKSMSEIRDYMTEYIAAKGTLDPQDYYVDNWSLLPASLYGESAAMAPATLPVSGGAHPDSSSTALYFLLGGGLLIVVAVVVRRRTNRIPE